ncbi:MarR family winged helix-turn-helix transcriptional regulator [Paenibacillus radicis (ex Xue et al. 2023)]|uniref:MarR family winged helix-turn-helix transcriptional regulator n=1 Tax=Paenibacillus radicis (ex Xue et al. 2023) TaxID=2972489 RepID=A0ABT1Y951_9BACL|nr:MarR family winged helix-turn-helix transcriptional regulator [Paenibacillus radicis (ex Xue et al. 2023)]MCR8629707.1 MarR family winged helix-turn-helix transcriptional regulator [Paenibacillus radicis (ex Xue et al. 2023)]
MNTSQIEVELQQVFRRILRKVVVYGRYVDSRFSGSQVAALEVIQRQGPIKVTHLSESLSLSLSAVTLLCDKLIQNGYLIRDRDDEDRRVVYLNITMHGREVLENILASEKELVSQWLNGLSEPELEQFNRTFQHIVGNVQPLGTKKAEDQSCCN